MLTQLMANIVHTELFILCISILAENLLCLALLYEGKYVDILVYRLRVIPVNYELLTI